MKLAALRRSLALLLCLAATAPGGAAAESTTAPRDLEGVWKIFTTLGQVGLCEAAAITSLGTIERGRVTTRVGKVRLEPAENGSWRIKRLRLDGTPEVPTRRWRAFVRPDGEVLSSLRSQASCPGEPPRFYELELRGKLKEKKRLRIELRGTDVVCEAQGCSFKVTHTLTREPDTSPSSE